MSRFVHNVDADGTRAGVMDRVREGFSDDLLNLSLHHRTEIYSGADALDLELHVSRQCNILQGADERPFERVRDDRWRAEILDSFAALLSNFAQFSGSLGKYSKSGIIVGVLRCGIHLHSHTEHTLKQGVV